MRRPFPSNIDLPPRRRFVVVGFSALATAAALLLGANALAQFPAATPAPPAPPPQAVPAGPDHVVLKSGHLFAGTLKRRNEQQVEIDTERHGRLLIEMEAVAEVFATTPPERISTEVVDPALFARDPGAVATSEIPQLKPGERLFSVMPGEAGRGGYLQAGPVNPLDSRLYLRVAAPAATADPAVGAPEAMVLEVRGRAEWKRGANGAWEPAAKDASARAGDSLRVVAGKMAVRLRGGAVLLLHQGSSLTLGKVGESGESLSLVLASGHVWVEREAGLAATVETSHAKIDATSRGFAAIADSGATEFALFDGTASVTSLLQPGSPPTSVAAMNALRVEAAGLRALPALGQPDLLRYRDPNP